MQILKRNVLSLCALVAFSLAPVSASTVWNFSGTCLDCPGLGIGTLTATPTNIATTFTFTYTSDWISYTMTNPVVSIDESPFFGPNFTFTPSNSIYLIQSNITIQSSGGTGNPLSAGAHQFNQVFFSLASNGTWSTGGVNFLDFGINGAFTQSTGGAVPEPSTLALTGLGALAVGLYRRRQTS